MPIDETIGQNLGNESLEENLCILGVPEIQEGAEPEGYNLSYSFLSKSFYVSTYIKNVVVKFHISRLDLHWAFRI